MNNVYELVVIRDARGRPHSTHYFNGTRYGHVRLKDTIQQTANNLEDIARKTVSRGLGVRIKIMLEGEIIR